MSIAPAGEPAVQPRGRVWIRRAASVRLADVLTAAWVLRWAISARVLLSRHGFGGAARSLGLVPTPVPDVQPGEIPALSPRARRALRVTLWLLDRSWMPVRCLVRSIVVQRMMARHGIEADLVIGCATTEGFKAHAWVEVSGRPVGRHEHGASSWTLLARMRAGDEARVAAR